ncbi:hypothetical protein GCM10009582_19480 [Arthrobacter flavus]
MVPLLCLTLWGLLAFGLLSLMGPSSFELPVFGVVAGAGLAGATIRGAFQPSPDWTTMGGSSNNKLMPAGVETSFVRGPDFIILAMLPALLALFIPDPSGWLLASQAALSTFCLWRGTRAD